MPRVFSAPGVYRREIDISEILVATGISNGGIIGRFRKGPIRRPVLVANDKEFIERFGSPFYSSGSGTTGVNPLIPEYGYGSYAAIEFLKESSTLYVVRSFDSGDVYAAIQVDNDTTTANTNVSAGIAPLTATPESFDTKDEISSVDAITNSEPLIVSYVSPGTDGNNYAVTIETLSPDSDWLYQYDDYPSDLSASTSAIWTSSTSGDIAKHFPIASKVFKLKVYQKPEGKLWTDLYSNSADKASSKLRLQEIESYYGTLAPMLDTDGNDLHIEKVINGLSKNIYVKSNIGQSFLYSYNFAGASATLPGGEDDSGAFVYNGDQLCKLANGATTKSNGLNSRDDEFWTYFESREELPVQILINPTYVTTTKQAAASVAAKRLDCIVSNQVGSLSNVTYQDVMEAESYGYVAPSYVALYGGYSKVYDNYNDKFVWLPNAIFGAALFARVDNIANPWDAPAGINRAVLAVSDQYKIYSQDHIGKMYDKNINSVRFIRGTGFVMWGQKTAQLKKSALDRINVRRNLLFIENNIETALFPFTFENNTEQTRLRCWSIVDEFLAGVQAGGGVTAYDVVCDATNNTSDVIDRNTMNVDIYVQPSRTAEFIQFTTVVTRTGVSFSDVRLKYS